MPNEPIKQFVNQPVKKAPIMVYINKYYISVGAFLLMLFGLSLIVKPSNPSPQQILAIIVSIVAYIGILIIAIDQKVNRMEK